MTDPRDEQMRLAFQRVFGTTNRSLEQRIVWAFLTQYCRKNKSTYQLGESERDHARRAGRREVFLEIEERVVEPEITVDQILPHIGEHNDD